MRAKEWNPYLCGALTGALLVLSVVVSGKFLGASTTFARGAAAIEEAVGIDASRFEYFTTSKGKYGPQSLPDWQLMFVIGIMLGAFISARASGDFRIQAVPDMWRKRFGPSAAKRAAAAFLGGFIAVNGARLAGGCPSGHGLSGLSQLAVSGFIALACFFIGGAITANLIYGKTGR
jgi:uncharacterized membrane protein YedE/YeeE